MKKHTTTIPHCKYCGFTTKSGTGKGLVMHELYCLENPDNFKHGAPPKKKLKISHNAPVSLLKKLPASEPKLNFCPNCAFDVRPINGPNYCPNCGVHLDALDLY
jgi:hypothetical protein